MNTFYTHTHNVVSVCGKYEKNVYLVKTKLVTQALRKLAVWFLEQPEHNHTNKINCSCKFEGACDSPTVQPMLLGNVKVALSRGIRIKQGCNSPASWLTGAHSSSL